MKTFKFLSVALVIGLMTSCGGKNKKEANDFVPDESVEMSSESSSSPIIITHDSEDADEATSDDAEEAVTESSSSSDVSPEFESAMKDYEAAFESYAEVMKKISDGDATAALEMSKYSQKLQSAISKLESMKSDLTPAEIKRMNEAISKGQKAMTEAMSH